jgi:hypothetical protein
MCDHQNMTPAEVTQWLDKRQRERRQRRMDRINRTVNLVLIVILLAIGIFAAGAVLHCLGRIFAAGGEFADWFLRRNHF